jgi:sulfoxide reductase heme-binding subunit YedZ
VASLAATPAHDLLGLTWPVRLRRLVGLFAFAYATAHLLFYVAVDQLFDWRVLWADVTRRRFMVVGFAAWLALVPLAVTSTDRWVRRLGFTRWKRLHRLAYAAGALGVVHFLWRVKADRTRPLVFAAALAALFLARVPAAFSRARRARARAQRAADRANATMDRVRGAPT